MTDAAAAAIGTLVTLPYRPDTEIYLVVSEPLDDNEVGKQYVQLAVASDARYTRAAYLEALKPLPLQQKSVVLGYSTGDETHTETMRVTEITTIGERLWAVGVIVESTDPRATNIGTENFICPATDLTLV